MFRTRSEKRRLLDVLECINERLAVIDESQAQVTGGIEYVRSSLHAINGHLTPMKLELAELMKASDTDAREIQYILTKIDLICEALKIQPELIRARMRSLNDGTR